MTRDRDDVAVVGLACRFPGARDAEAFWSLLDGGRCGVSEVPPERWLQDDYYDPNPAAPGKIGNRRGGFIEDVDAFDAGFFRITPREAAEMDPQQRVFLEVAWDALEDAGLTEARLRGSRTGVFAGVMFHDHGARLLQSDPTCIGPFSGTGSIATLIPNRLSHRLDLRGPSLAVDTGCSSSLVAVHLALRSLASGECELAIVGGVNVILAPGTSVFYTKAGLMAPDGLCKAFDARADGIVRGEGCGVVVLKALSRARADGDRVHARVLGSAINHNGTSNGVGAPSAAAQESLLRAAYADAAVDPGRVQYVEAHGTGTRIGDASEAKALGAVLGATPERREPCHIGSVKSNLGHLEAAAGIAGFVKTCLALSRRRIPPTLHVSEPSPAIPFARAKLRVAIGGEPWPAAPGDAIAGVSSFGIGGANAHVVLQDTDPVMLPVRREPTEETDTSGQRLSVLALSARSEAALRELAQRHLARLEAATPASLDDVSAASFERRTPHGHRLAVLGADVASWRAALASYRDGRASSDLKRGAAGRRGSARLAFVCSGQGAEWWRHAASFLERKGVFARALDDVASALRPALERDLRDLLASADASLGRPELAQPLLFALQTSLGREWLEAGADPIAIVGHSIGDVAAAHLAGALDLEDAARVVAERSRAVASELARGSMVALRMGWDEAWDLLAREGVDVTLAVENAPQSVSVSGATSEVERFARRLDELGVWHRRLHVDRAFHGGCLAPLRAPLEQALAGICPKRAKHALYTGASGGLVDGSELGAAYWARQLCEPVRFRAALEAALADGAEVCLELAPEPLLGGPIRDCAAPTGRSVPVVSAGARAQRGARGALVEAAAELFAAGVDARYADLLGIAGRSAPLPSYPWQRTRFPLGGPWRPTSSHGARKGTQAPAPRGGHPLLGAAVDLAGDARTWQADVDPSTLSWLRDHRVQGATVMPGVAWLDLAFAALRTDDGAPALELEAVEFRHALVVPDGARLRIETRLEPDADRWRLGIHARVESDGRVEAWRLCATARLRGTKTVASDEDRASDAEPWQRCDEAGAEAFYAKLAAQGFEFGPSMRGVRRFAAEGAWSRAIVATGPAASAGAHALAPALLDGCATVLLATVLRDESPDSRRGQWLPVGADRVVLSLPEDATQVRVEARAEAVDDPLERRGDVRAYDARGRLVFACEGGRFRFVGRGAVAATAPDAETLHRVAWDAFAPQAAGALPAACLVVGGADALADRVAAALAARGLHVGRVATPRAGAPDADELVAAAAALRAKVAPDAVLSVVWLEAAPPQHGTRAETLVEAAVATLQACFRLPGPTRIWLVTEGAQAAGESAPGARGIAGAALWGLGRAASRERAEAWGGLVDLDPNESSPGNAAGLGDLVAGAWREQQFALRAGRALVARLERAPAHALREPGRLDPSGAYWITGGLGDLGLLVARRLVERGARRLVLFGRSGLARGAGAGSAAEPSTVDARARAVAALEALGASVAIELVDVGDRAEFARVVERLRREGPEVRGVVHAAGVGEGGLLDELDADRIARVLRPKVAGADVLHEAFRDPRSGLAFFVLFASVSGLVGSLGQGLAAYASANAYLDGLAQLRRAQGTVATSIDWGPWQGAGLLARAGREDALRDRGLGALEPARALDLFERLAWDGGAQWAVLPIDWPRWAQHNPAEARTPFLARCVPAAERPAPWAGAGSSEATRGAIVQALRESVAEVLGVSPEDVPPDRSLSEVGSDSIVAVELRERIESLFDVALPVRAFLEDPSLDELSQRVLAELVGDGPAVGSETRPGDVGGVRA